jgi:hypothetical protein
MTVTISLHFDPNTDLAEALDYLTLLGATDDQPRGVDQPRDIDAPPIDEKRAPSAAEKPDVVILYEETDPRHRSRRFLEALSAEPELLVDLVQKSDLRKDDGSVLPAASLRAVHRNLAKTENRLIKEGRIKGKVVAYDWSRYDIEGAGRYFLRPADLDALDHHLNR